MIWLSKPWKVVLMIAPAAIIYGVFLVYPIIYSIYYSFTDSNGINTPHLNKGANYVAMVHDTFFWKSFENTGIVLGVALVFLIPLGFLLAVLLSDDIPGAGIMRAMVFAPAIVAPILVGLIWVFILDPHIGLVNATLAALGVSARPMWIGGTELSPFSYGMVFVWEQLGFILTIFYAGIRMLPADVFESAALDGASRLQQIRYITVPMLQETFGIVTVLVITGVFRIFELVYELTGGGPIHLGDVLVTYMYYQTFSQQMYGYGMSIAVVICALGALASGTYFWLARRRRS
jgi:raffinose/stachyose/melibiose transport system permease protein